MQRWPGSGLVHCCSIIGLANAFYVGGAYEVSVMHNEFTAIIETDGQWYIAYCPEIPGANGHGKTKDEARASLAQAISLILQDR